MMDLSEENDILHKINMLGLFKTYTDLRKQEAAVKTLNVI